MRDRRFPSPATIVRAAVSAESPTLVVDPDGLRESLAEICASQQDFHRFFSGVFDELHALSAELLRRQHAWLAERHQSEVELDRKAERLERERAAIAAEREEVWAQIDQKRAQLVAGAAETDGTLKQILEETCQDRTALQAALQAAQTQAAQLAEVAGELAEARQEIQRLRDGLKDAQADPSAAQPDPRLQQELLRTEKERAELQQERLVLETELESVRNRAAELSETLAEQRRESAEERNQWSQELNRMRRLIESLSAQQFEPGVVSLPQRPSAARGNSAPAPPEPAPAVARGPDEEDAALASVMAQFEMLQRDLVRRRKSQAKSA